eukprot:scaffold112260_cov63-Phaeocystis_antarctica.AAC.1
MALGTDSEKKEPTRRALPRPVPSTCYGLRLYATHALIKLQGSKLKPQRPDSASNTYGGFGGRHTA